jgi:transposase
LAKFTSEERIKATKRYLDGNESFKTIAEEIGVHKSKLQYWVKKYQYHGEKAFIKCYTNYSVPYKLDVLNYMNENGTSLFETAAIFNLPSDSTLRQWQHLLDIKGMDALIPKKKGRPSMKKETKKPTKSKGAIEGLQEEVERLRMENAYLKKLNALVQNKKSPNKTKRK